MRGLWANTRSLRSIGGLIPRAVARIHASVPELRKPGGPVPQHRVRVSLEDPTGYRRVRLASVDLTQEQALLNSNSMIRVLTNTV